MQFVFLLISGRNPDYLIEHQVKAAPLKNSTSYFYGLYANESGLLQLWSW
jgi:hypothetical protein